MNYILRLLGEIEQELLSSGTAIWSKRVDADKCLSLLAKVVNALPKTMDEADIIVAEKNRILDNARISAQEIIEEAERRAYSEISLSAIKRRAEAEANEIRKQAEYSCNQLSLQNQTSIASMYDNFEKYIVDMLNITRNQRNVFSPKPKSTQNKSRSTAKRKK